MPPSEIQKLITKARSDERDDPPPAPTQHQTRLSQAQQTELVDRYQAGALQRELAAEFDVDRRTVMAIVRRHGARRRRGLDDAGAMDAARRYESGESLAMIGSTLQVDPATVRNHLLARGVPMRDSHGRERS